MSITEQQPIRPRWFSIILLQGEPNDTLTVPVHWSYRTADKHTHVVTGPPHSD